MRFKLDDYLVQVAGITTEEEALLSIGLGANAVSFDFYNSRYQVSSRDAFHIVRRLPAGTVTIGTFRQESPRRIIEIVENLGLNAVELLGAYGDEEMSLIRSSVSTVIRGINAETTSYTIEDLYPADYFLLSEVDEYDDLVHCWQSLPEGAPRERIILGGLTLDTVIDVIQTTPVAGVRVLNGALNERGEKDLALLGHFVADARYAHSTSL
jgi:phosphoribosylanthranilate isomerase